MPDTQENEKFQFTPENLIENISKLGAWSAYGLATEALNHYFPELYNEGYTEVEKEIEALNSLGCQSWQDIIIKYQNEVGYDAPNGFNYNCVNES